MKGVDILSPVDESGALFGGQFETSPITRESPTLRAPEYSIIHTLEGATLANGVVKTLQREIAGLWNDSRIESFHPPGSHQKQNIIKAIPRFKLPCTCAIQNIFLQAFTSAAALRSLKKKKKFNISPFIFMSFWRREK